MGLKQFKAFIEVSPSPKKFAAAKEIINVKLNIKPPSISPNVASAELLLKVKALKKSSENDSKR